MLKIIPIPAFRDNYIWTLVRDGLAVCVDPGEAAPVQAFLANNNLRLAAILNTHHHWDHTGGNIELMEQFSAPLYGPATEKIQGITHKLVEGDIVQLDEIGVRLQVLDIPGHTAGHIALYNDDMLFCGDTLFACGCGRLFEGTPQQMSHSLAKLAQLKPTTKVYCGHEYTMANIAFAKAAEPGNAALPAREQREAAKRTAGEPTLPSTIADELATNPFLRCAEPAVIRSVEQHAAKNLPNSVAVFTQLREWKNNF
jgi:hydroxyacylglutathione hydrolase